MIGEILTLEFLTAVKKIGIYFELLISIPIKKTMNHLLMHSIVSILQIQICGCTIFWDC